MEKLIGPTFRSALRDRRGVAGVAVAAAAAGLISMLGFAADIGMYLTAKQALQANTNAAVLDAAYQWEHRRPIRSNSAAQGWSTAHPVPSVSGITATASAVCATTSGLPACGTGNNAIALTQTGTVPTFFVRILGINCWTMSATPRQPRPAARRKP